MRLGLKLMCQQGLIENQAEKKINEKLSSSNTFPSDVQIEIHITAVSPVRYIELNFQMQRSSYQRVFLR
jgi:hypothetical protein